MGRCVGWMGWGGSDLEVSLEWIGRVFVEFGERGWWLEWTWWLYS